MTDKEIVEKVNIVLKRVDDFFNVANVVPESYKQTKEQSGGGQFVYRNLWLRDKNHQIKPNQNMFSFSADDIDKYKIPSYVVGCSGRANLFAKYAKEIGLQDVFIVPCVKISDIGNQNMDGHQIVAVKMSSGLQLLNPASGVHTFERAKINAACKVNEQIDAAQHGRPEYRIAAILTPSEHEKITSREQLMQIYNRVSRIQKFQSATNKIKDRLKHTKLFQKIFQSEND